MITCKRGKEIRALRVHIIVIKNKNKFHIKIVQNQTEQTFGLLSGILLFPKKTKTINITTLGMFDW